MRTREFEVPRDIVGDFFSQADEADLDIEMQQVNEDGELVVEIKYEDRERNAVMNLIEMVDDYYSDQSDDE